MTKVSRRRVFATCCGLCGLVSVAAGACSLAGLSGGGEAMDDAGDASIDGFSDRDAPGTQGWCAQQVPAPKFCDDFDRDEPIAFGWLPGGGIENAKAETRVAASSPRSLLSQLPEDAGGC